MLARARYGTVGAQLELIRRKRVLSCHSNLVILGSIMYLVIGCFGIVPWTREGYLVQITTNALSLYLVQWFIRDSSL